MRLGDTADACFAQLRCEIRTLFAGLLMSLIRRTPRSSDSFVIVQQILLCQNCVVELIVEVLDLSDEVDQYLVQRLIEQLGILQTSLDFAVFPEPILSSADVAQLILDTVVAKRLPTVLLEDSVLYVSRVLVRLVSILLISLPLPKFLADLEELDLLLEKIVITTPFVLRKIAHLLHVRVAELASAHHRCALRDSLPKY